MTAVDAVTWLGHATVAIESGGARLLTDPVLKKTVGHLWRYAQAPPIPGELDGILLSHAHRDHFDIATLNRIPKDVPLVAPAGIDRSVHRLGREIIEVPIGETTTIGGTPITAFEVDHDDRRAPWSKPGAAAGFLVGEAGSRIWFPGDTDLHPGMEELHLQVALALVPIWGWGPSLGPGHLDPHRAAEAVARIAPQVAVPIHWGTYLPVGLKVTHGHLLTAPAATFAEDVGFRAPGTIVRELMVGERLELPALPTP